MINIHVENHIFSCPCKRNNCYWILCFSSISLPAMFPKCACRAASVWKPLVNWNNPERWEPESYEKSMTDFWKLEEKNWTIKAMVIKEAEDIIFLSKGTALVRDKSLHVFLHVCMCLLRWEGLWNMFWDYVLFFIIIAGATAVPNNSNKLSRSYCRSHCVKEELKKRKWLS